MAAIAQAARNQGGGSAPTIGFYHLVPAVRICTEHQSVPWRPVATPCNDLQLRVVSLKSERGRFVIWHRLPPGWAPKRKLMSIEAKVRQKAKKPF